ncbi:hypothetical protein ACGYK4_08105 [Sulfitobacter sp. 1A13368]|uniref:hypothetical protein n=1 Tax=Sulfitobacter sp. 1A13368 TaxID=3368593 RepID=UPI003744FAA5
MTRILSKNEVSAVKFSVRVVGTWAGDNRISVPALDPTLREVVTAFEPVYQQRGASDRTLLGYDIVGVDSERIVSSFFGNLRAHEFLLHIAKINIGLGYPLPDVLRQLVIEKLSGEAASPSDGGMRNVAERNILFVMMAEWMKEKCGLPKVSDAKFSAAEALWAAGTVFGVPVTKSQISKILRESKRLRIHSEAHSDVLGVPTSSSPVVNALLGWTADADSSKFDEPIKNAFSMLGHPLSADD